MYETCHTSHTHRPPLSERILPDMPLSDVRLAFLIPFHSCTVRARTIILITLSPISNTNVPDFIPNLHPFLTAGRNRTNLAQGPVRQARDEETSEEVDIVDVFRTLRHRLSDGSNEPNNVDEDTADIGCISAPVEAKGEVIRCCFASRVEVRYLVVAAADDVVIADDDPGDRGEKDGVGGQVGCEVIGRGEEVPVDERVRDGLYMAMGRAHHGHMAKPTAAQM